MSDGDEKFAPVVGTNDSATISKASMEFAGYMGCILDKSNLLIHPNLSHLFIDQKTGARRRAPLINRGYFVRVAIIRTIILRFFRKYSQDYEFLNLVILGSGFDTTWLWSQANPELSNMLYVFEIDLPSVISRKWKSLRKILTISEDSFRKNQVSQNYWLLSGDLRKLEFVSNSLKSACSDLGNGHFPTLFLSECVLSYLTDNNADQVISWASSGVNGLFRGSLHLCMYEQLLSNWLDPQFDHFDPFAKTMLDHFDRLDCSLHSAKSYPSKDLQKCRLLKLGWGPEIFVRSVSEWLFGLQNWSSNITEESLEWIWPELDRCALEGADNFDEWAEWNLKLAHYTVIECSNGEDITITHNFPTDIESSLRISRYCEQACIRLKSITLDCLQDHKSIKHLSRQGFSVAILNTSTIYYLGKSTRESLEGCFCAISTKSWLCRRNLAKFKYTSRLSYHSMCAWIPDRLVVCGGRIGNPRNVDYFLSNSCWVYHAFEDRWENLDTSWINGESCKFVLYRHESAIINLNYMYIIGGIRVEYDDQGLVRRYPNNKIYILDLLSRKWSVFGGSHEPSISFDCRIGHSVSILANDSLLVIGGEVPFDGRSSSPSGYLIKNAECFVVPEVPPIRWHSTAILENFVYLIGGMIYSRTGNLSLSPGIICIELVTNFTERSSLLISDMWLANRSIDHSRLWLQNRAVVLSDQKNIVVFGNEVVCFSMGCWRDPTLELVAVGSLYSSFLGRISIPNLRTIDRYLVDKLPFVLFSDDLRRFTSSWSLKTLQSHLGPDQLISVHRCAVPNLTFCPRNYDFVVMPVSEFCSVLLSPVSKERYYFRSIGSNPRKCPSNLDVTYPLLSQDPIFELLYSYFPVIANPACFFSSVLRVSSRDLELWLHYDVMDNILIQLQARKIVTLWPPKDLPHLYMEGSSSRINVPILNPSSPSMEFLGQFPLFANSHPITFVLEPGDVLYIPPFWFHHVRACDDVPSIAINIFWKNLEISSYYSRKDLYGNHELTVCDRAFSLLESAFREIECLPPHYQNFYNIKMKTIISQNSYL